MSNDNPLLSLNYVFECVECHKVKQKEIGYSTRKGTGSRARIEAMFHLTPLTYLCYQCQNDRAIVDKWQNRVEE